MAFSCEATFPEEPSEAHERLMLDAPVGDATLFIRSDEVEQCWQIIDPIIAHWANNTGRVPSYVAALSGPVEADQFVHRDGRAWHNA